MNSVSKILAVVFAVLFAGSVQAQQNPTSIDASACLDKTQLTSLEAAAQKDDVLAMRALRLYYFSCAGDRSKLLVISKRAAEIGVASDVEAYASAVEDVYGMSKAVPIFVESARMGDSLSQFTVAKAYQDGNGVPKDEKAALMWFELGANCYGHKDNDWGLINMRLLALFLLKEQPVPLAKLKGLAWLNVLANSRAGLSQKDEATRQKILSILSPAETEMVNEFASEFAEQGGCTVNSK